MKKRTGAMIASLVAGLFLAGNVMAEDAPATGAAAAKVKCSGVNSCKGTGACSSATNTCKGQNGCKGKGWMEMDSEKACADKGGTVVKS